MAGSREQASRACAPATYARQASAGLKARLAQRYQSRKLRTIRPYTVNRMNTGWHQLKHGEGGAQQLRRAQHLAYATLRGRATTSLDITWTRSEGKVQPKFSSMRL